MNDRPPTIRLKLDLPCTERDALLFTALVIYLYQIERDPGAIPDRDLDEALGNNARAVIAAITSGLGDFGIESTYDRAASTLHIRDIDGKPNAAAISQALLSLFPTRLPIAFSVSSAVDPDKPVWTIVDHAKITVADNQARVRQSPKRRHPTTATDHTNTIH